MEGIWVILLFPFYSPKVFSVQPEVLGSAVIDSSPPLPIGGKQTENSWEGHDAATGTGVSQWDNQGLHDGPVT